MKAESINPFNGDLIATYDATPVSQIETIIQKANNAFLNWKQTDVSSRLKILNNVASILRSESSEFGKLITLEMGKPLKEAVAEVEKCAWACEYFAENAAKFLKPEQINTNATSSYIRYDPLGVIFAVMPWNYPFWQVFRFAAPNLMAGNAGILKHASNVSGCSTAITQLFLRAGLPEGLFSHVITGHEHIEKIVASPYIKGVSLTGSEPAGRSVAALAGKYLKRSVLELGGSNAFVILDDADINKITPVAVTARMQNSGQSCIAAKRFIVTRKNSEKFLELFADGVSKLKYGNPMDANTTLGPLARKDLAENLNRQVKDSVNLGAEILMGGHFENCYHDPTILTGVKPGMPAFDEETFGPLAAITVAGDDKEALELAANTAYGLGITICSENKQRFDELASMVNDGACFFNDLVKSDPRLPFGGTGISGYGRELARDGMLEFVNRKTVYIK